MRDRVTGVQAGFGPSLIGVPAEAVYIVASIGRDDLSVLVKDDERGNPVDIEELLEQSCQVGIEGDGRPFHLRFSHIVVHVFFAFVATDEDDLERNIVPMAMIAEINQLGREGTAGAAPVSRKIQADELLALEIVLRALCFAGGIRQLRGLQGLYDGRITPNLCLSK